VNEIKVNEIRLAKAGDPNSEKARKRLAGLAYRDFDATPKLVEPKADGDQGQWFDIDDGYPAQHNMDRDSHAEAHPKHRWAWRNFATGNVEEP